MTLPSDATLIWDLGLSTRAKNTLHNSGIETLGQLLAAPRPEKLPNCGRKTYLEIQGVRQWYAVARGVTVEPWFSVSGKAPPFRWLLKRLGPQVVAAYRAEYEAETGR